MPRGVYVRRKRAVADRFWEKVAIGQGADDCWLWTGCTDDNGYGRFSINGKSEKAQRVAFEFSAILPKHLITRHRCDNPPCVRPAHVILGTQADNMRDMYERGRNAQPRGERAARAKLTEPQVIAIRRKAATGVTLRALAAEFGIAHQNIHQIITGRAWKHVGEGAA